MNACTARRDRARWILTGWFAVAALGAPATGQDVPPENFTIAFFGDQGLTVNSRQVLQLVGAEGAHAVMHVGDFDYDDNPKAWNAQINKVLGASFPYFAVVGNHDEKVYYGKKGYQHFIKARMKRLGIPWHGDLGVRSSFKYQGILFVGTAPGLLGDGNTVHAPYIRERLAADDSIWKISAWHVLMKSMQVGEKEDQSGWGVYEESRLGGAIIATAHEHSYARTHALASCMNQEVASFDNHFRIGPDDPNTPSDEGRTFVFHNGLGGHSIREQLRCMPHDPPYGCNSEWARIYTESQGASHGALFGVFNHQGNPCEAYFYFKDINGLVVDQFYVRSMLGWCAGCRHDLTGDARVDEADLEVLTAAWGACPGECQADMDQDGLVDVRDLISLLANWGWCGPRE